MSWRVEWKALSDRISGLLDSGRFYLESKAIQSSDPYGVAKNQLLPQAQKIFDELQRFHTLYASVLPSQAATCLSEFVSGFASKFSGNVDAPQLQAAVQFRVTALVSFRSEFHFHLTDFAAFAKRLSERAFLHIQRSIVADPDERAKWKHGFGKGEVECEKLGAARLLLHGLWAFKVNAAGERTDLVFDEPIGIEQVERSAEALVLTEWKIAKSRSEISQKVNEAKSQAKRYSQGALAGLELTRYRYLVIVSDKTIDMPPDDCEGDVTYRCINIAVDPDTPSRSSRPLSK